MAACSPVPSAPRRSPRPSDRQVDQRSIDELGVPLADVEFCVIDIETTGTDRGDDGITEIGAVKVRGGEVTGTLGTFVNPGRAIPPQITLLTGITDSMVITAPRPAEVLVTLQEFLGEAVIVGHNVGFDLGFINTALRRSGRDPLPNRVVDTLPLARRLVRDESPDCRLGTLAKHLRLAHQPTHRALDDALATMHLLHLLLERAASLGVLGLDDLLSLPAISSHPQASKLPLTLALPRSPGVYRFIGSDDEVLYVGKATNVRQRVRSYFGSDERRKVGALLREVRRIDYSLAPDALVAEVLELRYLHALRPRYNRVGTTWDKYCYVRLDTDSPWPRLSIVRTPHATGVHLGPLSSRAAATAVIEAVQTVIPIRRCSHRAGARSRVGTCHGPMLGVAICPAAPDADERQHWLAVAQAAAALTTDPDVVLVPLWARVARLAAEQRYEEAALARDRANAYAAAMSRQQQSDRLRAAGDLGVRIGDTVLHVRDGVLVGAHPDGQLDIGLDLPPPLVDPYPAVLPAAAADETWCLGRAFDRAGDRLRLLWCSGGYALPSARVRVVDTLAAAAGSTAVTAAIGADSQEISITAPA
ncbi:MAG: putative polymerase epsilon subunit [Actinomycetota bacterium]